MGIFDFFRKRNKYIPTSEKPMYGIRLATREVMHARHYKDALSKKYRAEFLPSLSNLFTYPINLFEIRKEAEKYDPQETDYSSKNNRLFESIHFDIIKEFVKDNICLVSEYMYDGTAPYWEDFDSERVFGENDNTFRNYQGCGIGLERIGESDYQHIPNGLYDIDNNIETEIVIPIATREELYNCSAEELEKFNNIENCYIKIQGLYQFVYNPNAPGFSKEEVYEKIRKIVEDKYNLKFNVQEKPEEGE